jgi:NAD(P)-dependent dehydrogenase (short-subunit alcohol dehydrogenase family)
MITDIFTVSSFLVAFIAAIAVQLFSGQSSKPSFTLEERKKYAVLVTGASRGIGKTITAHLSSLGYTVFGSVRSNSSYDELLKANDSVLAKGEVVPIQFDVTDDKAIAAAAKTVEETCKRKNLELIGIINNAGINPEGDAMFKTFNEGGVQENVLAESSVVTEVFNTNVVGVFRVTRAFMPLLNKQRGRIIIIGSFFGTIAGSLRLPHLAYESSKFALEGLADGLRRGLKNEGIQVSLVKPGMIKTLMSAQIGESPPIVVSQDVLTALEAKRPSARYYPGMVKGLPCKSLCDFFALLPTFITDSQL